MVLASLIIFPNQTDQTGAADEKCNLPLLQENRSFGRKNEGEGNHHLSKLQISFGTCQKIPSHIRLGRGSIAKFISQELLPVVLKRLSSLDVRVIGLVVNQADR